MQWHKSNFVRVGAAMAAVALLAVGCSSSKGTSTGGGNSGGSSSSSGVVSNGLTITNYNNSGTPVRGGTLTVLGTSDVDNNLDPNVGYYTLDEVAYQLYERNLYTYPSIPGKTFTLMPDLATAEPTVSDGGLKYAVTIRTGAMWNTTPPRQVTAQDVIYGVKRSCNPTYPYGGQPDFADVLAGYQQFCTGFGKVSSTSAAAQKAYIMANNISGVTVDPSNPLTVDFTLTKPANYFSGVLTLAPFNPIPVEELNYLDYSLDLAHHLFSDGPYVVASYNPNTSIKFTRNPAWNASSDPIRKAYVNEIDVSETGNQAGIYQQILTNTPAADMMWDVGVPATDIPQLIASKDPRFQLQTEGSTNPYVIFNTISKNNNGALKNVLVRQAISYALSRDQLLQNHGGPQVDPPLTHLIAPGTDGSSPNFDDYPYNPTKAKQLLQQAGVGHLTLKLLYRPQNISAQKDFQTIQANLGAVGITVTGVGVSNADFYGKYLVPGTAAKNSVWDLAEAGWGPDWYPTGGKSYFLPILNSASVPPNGSNYGFFTDPTLDQDMTNALNATSDSAASADWHTADQRAMDQAAVYPVADPNQGSIHGQRVHNFIYIGPLQNPDLANIWLS